MDIFERINTIIATENLNVASFARKIGIGDQIIRNIVVLKRNNPSFVVLSHIIEAFPMLSVEWLLTGRGAMVKASSNTDCITELINYLRERDAKIEQAIIRNIEIMNQCLNPKGNR